MPAATAAGISTRTRKTQTAPRIFTTATRLASTVTLDSPAVQG